MVETNDLWIEEGLQRIAAACERQRQQPLAVAERLGQLMGENPRAAGLFRACQDIVRRPSTVAAELVANT